MRKFIATAAAFFLATSSFAATPQPNWLSGLYTLAAGPDNLQDNLPAAAYCYSVAWAIDRPGGAGFMAADCGLSTPAWVTNAGPQGATGATGATGAPGVDGNTVLSGTGSPGSGLGKNGDYYLDVTVTRLYGPKTSGVWGTGVALIGPQGSAGTNGTNGTNGTSATVAVGTVTTGAAGSSASVSNVGTSSAAVFNFTIPRGDAGATGATGSTGSQGPAGFGTVTPSTTTRTIGTAFRPSTTNAVRVSYTIRTQVTNPLLVGTSVATVILYSDANTTPTTERARVAAESGVGVTVTLALTTANTATLSYIVPAGHYVLLSSSVSGTGATSIVSQVEEVLG